MEKWKEIGKKLLFPHLALVIFLAIAATAALIAVFACHMDEHPVAYVVYVLSFYALCVVCARMPGVFRFAKAGIYRNPYANRYLTEAQLRSRISLYTGTTVNLAYSIFKLIMGIVYHSVWFGAVAVYYMTVCVTRFLMIRFYRASMRKATALERRRYEWRRYRTVAVLMLALNVAISGMVFQMIWQNRGYSYPGTLIYAMAAYTFYRLTQTIIKLVKSRRNHSPVFSAATALDFCVSLVSIFALQTAMFAAFGAEEPHTRQIMNTLTGVAVCLIVVLTAVLMIRHSNTQLKKLYKEQCYGK